MKKFGLLSSSAIGSAALFGMSLAFAAPAYAQDELAAAPAQPEADEGQTVEVTGSRIRRPNVESQLPITSIGGEEFFQQGSNNIGDTLNDLPQLRSTFAQQNPGLGIGIAGLNLLDLRGLGTQRTLVLVNGRRHVGADILNNAVSPDVNTIPNDLIERVDVVTGGNSAIYGSDAIAGVINFILRRDFDGLQIRGNAAMSGEGYGANQYASAMYGMNFGDGRGNITLHAEYARQERVYASDIPAFRRNDAFGVVDNDTAGLPENSDGFPDRIFFHDLRSASIHFQGLVPITQRVAAPACGLGIAATNGAPQNTGNPYNCTYIFNAAGNLLTQTGTRFGTGIIGGIVGGNGQTGREQRIVSVLPGMQRYNANLLAHYSFSDALEAFVEAKFVRVDIQGSNAGPSFIQGTFGQYDIRERIRLDNPFLAPADRTTLTNAILTSGCNTSLTAACSAARSTFGGQGIGGALNAADIAAINAGTYRFVVSRLLLDSGIRDEDFQRDTWRVVGGLRGTFNDDWNYEISANYGKMEETTTTYGYVDRQRFMLALDAGRNPVTGAIQCRSQFDAASATPFTQNLPAATIAANQAKLAADIAACIPYNPIGGLNNNASASYFTYNATHTASQDQLVLSAFVGGDSSQLFELPGGPVRFAVGVEYRRENAFYEEDPFVQSGATNAVVIPTFSPPTFSVKEAFGEIQIPLLRDTPFFHELTVSGAARVASYGGGTGTVWSYNGGVEWSPIRDVRFRGNYGRAVRAPNVSETGFPVVPNFAPGFQDPCAPNQIGAGSTFRSANCQADLGALLPNLVAVTYSLPILSGSNPDLVAETSDSWTVGAVVQPRFLPGLSFTVDYYDITVNGVITSLSAQAIVNGCYDQPDLANTLCAQFTRFRGPGNGPMGEVAGAILGNSLNAAPFNFAKRIRRGVDFELVYRTNLGEDTRMNARLLYTHQLQNSNYQSATDTTFENRLLGELGDPVDEARFDVSLTHKEFTIGYRARYIGSMWVNLYEDFNSLQGRTPQDSDWADIRKFPSVLYHDLRFEWNVAGGGGIGENLNFFFGVDNVFDRDPPLGSTATGVGSAIYSIRGRNFYGGFRARF
jgi:outer membrane receptor protein involved in Fe transport